MDFNNIIHHLDRCSQDEQNYKIKEGFGFLGERRITLISPNSTEHYSISNLGTTVIDIMSRNPKDHKETKNKEYAARIFACLHDKYNALDRKLQTSNILFRIIVAIRDWFSSHTLLILKSGIIVKDITRHTENFIDDNFYSLLPRAKKRLDSIPFSKTVYPNKLIL